VHGALVIGGYPSQEQDVLYWVMWLSLLYPVGYTLLSIYLDWRMRAHHVSRPPK